MSLVAGKIFFKVAGVQENAKGNFSYNLGLSKREALIGADKVHGYKEVPQVAFIEGEITDRSDLDLAKLIELKDTSITLELANGKVILLRDAWFAGEGTVTTDEATIAVRYEGLSGEEV